MALIEARNIRKSFGNLQVLKGISASVEQGEIVTIVGASGAGKTTFLQIAGTLMKPSDGAVTINGTVVSDLRDKELARFRNRHIGFVFQFHHLLPEFSALENVCIPAFIAGITRYDAIRQAKELLGFLGLDHRINHKPNELSGGEQQRVAVARALINNPDVVLADEPSGNLDSQNKKELHELFFTLRNRYHQTFVIVTHDAELAGMSDRTITMHDGLLV
ncbi:MAG TPA: ABC transporter ATP-binding protein [Bacteroidales bacterium]|jgi:lipoprotein-releasing system ATP-binding protein|nr:ABC transporter ATP-binding protein [Bacteroidales bacterium]